MIWTSKQVPDFAEQLRTTLNQSMAFILTLMLVSLPPSRGCTSGSSDLSLNNFGVQELLDCFVEIAPSPRPTKAEERMVEPSEPKFTGFIFKITANIDPNHRSCIAFCKVCSGKFQRNQPYLHIRNGKTMRFSSPTQFMAQRKSTVEEAYPGDIVGLPDSGGVFKIGDTLTEGENIHFRGLPSFSPELFKYIENDDPMKSKQFQKGIEQLMK